LQQEIYQESGCVVEKRDFIFTPPTALFKSIVANPPYIRHHRLSAEMKAKLREISRRITELPLMAAPACIFTF
jgi:methylase of polypeptide subunit release factors